MGLCIRTITYRCADDCKASGCPGHEAELRYHSVSDAYQFTLNGREVPFERGELEAALSLLRSLNRHDAADAEHNVEERDAEIKALRVDVEAWKSAHGAANYVTRA